MKRLLRIFLLAAALVTVLCVSAMAADEPTAAGLYGFTPATGVSVTITPYTAANDTTAIVADSQVTGYENFYQGAVRFDVTYENNAIAAGEQYLLLVCSGTGDPDENNIVYINQKASVAGKVEFTDDDRAYPSSLGKGDYRIYVVGKHSAYDLGNPTAKFKYHVPYTLGDVNDDTAIDSDDALLVLKHSVHLVTLDPTPQLAADVNKDTHIDSDDALLILKYSVHLITEF